MVQDHERPKGRSSGDTVRPGNATFWEGGPVPPGNTPLVSGSKVPCQALLSLPGLRLMRDPTRGGLAAVPHEMPRATGSDVWLRRGDIPVQDPVRSVCQTPGFDPMYLACKGRLVAVVSPQDADEALRRWRALPAGQQAARVD